MVDGEDSGGHEPGQAQDGVDDDADGDNEEVQVVPASFLNKDKTFL